MIHTGCLFLQYTMENLEEKLSKDDPDHSHMETLMLHVLKSAEVTACLGRIGDLIQEADEDSKLTASNGKKIFDYTLIFGDSVPTSPALASLVRLVGLLADKHVYANCEALSMLSFLMGSFLTASGGYKLPAPLLDDLSTMASMRDLTTETVVEREGNAG